MAIPTKRWTRLARAGVADYWIVDLVDQVLEVYRVLDTAPDSPYGWRYGSAVTLRPGDRVRPLSAPHAEIPVADLLP
jgi:Uma2 family endonuclease